MRKLLAVLLTLALLGTLMVSFAAAEELEPITLTVFRGDPGDQPYEDNKIYKKIEEEFGVKFEFEFLAGDLSETVLNLITALFYAVILVFYSPVLTGIGVVSLVVSIIVAVVANKHIMNATMKLQMSAGKLSGAVCAGVSITVVTVSLILIVNANKEIRRIKDGE